MMFRSAVSFTICLIITGVAIADFNPFASEVIDISINGLLKEPNYLPAPGYYVDYSEYPYYTRACFALGAVSDASIKSQRNAGIVTLGGYGGKIVLAFDQNVENNPANPKGLDAIVFGNAWWYEGDPNLPWGEPATIEIMPELNDNNIPGDAADEIWYLIPGSLLPDACSFRTQHWDVDDPCICRWPDFTDWPDSYDTNAFEIFPVYEYVDDYAYVLANPNRNDGNPENDHLEYYWGYAELTPRVKLGDRNVDDSLATEGDCPNMPAELFYTFPDDPYITGIDSGTCGGDAFDICWAVDPATWQPANLPSFRYIRITTAADIRDFAQDPLLMEISAEIDAVADVRPYGDVNGDNKVDFADLELFSQTWLTEWPQQEFNPAADFVVDNRIDMLDYAKLAIGFIQ